LTEIYRTRKIPVIATGHLFVQGGQVSDSEREIQIGNLAAVASTDFPAFDYMALGHLHRPQVISKNPLTIYSGSPIPLSFSEIMYSKRVNHVITGFPEIEIQPVEVPLFRKLVKIEGTMQEVKARLEELQPHGNLPVWIDLQVVEEETDPLLLRIFDDFNEDFNRDNAEKQVIKHTIRFLSRQTEGSILAAEERTLNDLGEKQVFEKLLDQQGISERESLLQSFGELLELAYLDNANK
jgi:exonuclease SbcD